MNYTSLDQMVTSYETSLTLVGAQSLEKVTIGTHEDVRKFAKLGLKSAKVQKVPVMQCYLIFHNYILEANNQYVSIRKHASFLS